MTDREQLEAKAREVSQLIGSAMPPGVGYALFVFGFGPGGKGLSYISNAERASMISAVREWLAKQEDQVLGDATKWEPLYVTETLRAARNAGREVVLNNARHGPADPLGWARRAGSDA